MNYRYLVKQLGLLLLFLSGILIAMSVIFFLVEALLGHHVNPAARVALFISGLIGAAGGGILGWLTRGAPPHLGRREALLLVAVTWIFGAAFCALPFFLWAQLSGSSAPADHPFRSFVDCYFESMSGMTTTGATILKDVQGVPRSLLLWRAFTQWVGGLGIVVLFVAVLPTLGVGGKRLFLVEAPGPAPEGFQPQIRQTARVLLGIYLGLTVAQITALCLAGMSIFDSVCHTFATLATGGFSTRNASIGAFNSAAVDIIVIVFMALAAVNFGLYYAMLRRKHATVWHDPELRTYVILMLGGALVVVLCLLRQPMELTNGQVIAPSTGRAVRHGIFTTVSLMTTTGFCTADFNTWPFAAKAVLVMLMFVGGSAGSTAGGIKVIRIWVTIKVMLSEIEHVFRPNVVRPVRLGRSVLEDEMKLGTVTYVLGIILLFAAGSFCVMVFEQFNPGRGCDYTTAATASVACLCNVGPGLGLVGAVEHYGWLTPASKAVLSLLMALGRLEVFALIVLCTPRFWSGD